MAPNELTIDKSHEMFQFHLCDVQEPFEQHAFANDRAADIVLALYDFIKNVLDWPDERIDQALGEKGKRFVEFILSQHLAYFCIDDLQFDESKVQIL